jgi:hypothetical protein
MQLTYLAYVVRHAFSTSLLVADHLKAIIKFVARRLDGAPPV